MRISILTWHKALNHGAVLQAYASQKTIQMMGKNVEVLDYKRIVKDKRTILQKTKTRFERILSRDYLLRNKYLDFNTKKKEVFDQFISDNIKIGANIETGIFDCIMIGSDMVFNLLQGYSPYMFGVSVNTNYLFSYAACSGGSTIKTAQRIGCLEEINKGLSSFGGLSCRDETTVKFIYDVTNRNDIVENIDPVLLYGFEMEQKEWNGGVWKNNAPYILVYAYNSNMNLQTETRQIIKFARNKGLKLISVGYFHSWCDDNINASPSEFVEMVVNAQAVITDTFHGTVFSLICHKPFCSIIRENGFKLRYLLEQCDMTDRIADNSEMIIPVLEKEINYETFDSWIGIERKKGIEYLEQQIKKAELQNGKFNK